MNLTFLDITMKNTKIKLPRPGDIYYDTSSNSSIIVSDVIIDYDVERAMIDFFVPQSPDKPYQLSLSYFIEDVLYSMLIPES